MDVKRFSLAHGKITESCSFDVLKKSVRYISDSDRLTFVVVTEDNEVWAVSPNTMRFVFSINDVSEVSAMCFLPSTSHDDNCVALAVYDRKSADACLRIIDLNTMSDIYDRASAFPGRVTALTTIEPSFAVGSWALGFGLENGSIGYLLFSQTSCDLTMVDSMGSEFCHSPVTKMTWLKTRRLLVCGHESGFLSVCRLPSKQFVFGHQVDALPISCIVSTEPENDPRLTCFLWVSAANGRRSSAAIIFRIEGDNDNVICMGVHDLAANISETDCENAWAYLVDISSSRQLPCESSSNSSNLISFLWEIGVTGRSTDYYFALFDINAWFSWQSQANLHLKEPVFGGSKFLAVFRLPKSVIGENRLLGAFAISSSIASFRPRVSVVPLTSPLLYPCSLSFDVLCVSTEAITQVNFKSLQENLLRNCCTNTDFTRISDVQLSAFVEKLTTLGLIDMFDGSSIGCSHYESVLNAFFKFANDSDAVRFAKKIIVNEDYVAVFRNWLFYRAGASRKDLDVSLDLIFQKSEASEHLKAAESDMKLILRLAGCLPNCAFSFARDLQRTLGVFLNLISAFQILLKPDRRSQCFEALSSIPAMSLNGEKAPFFYRRFKVAFADATSSRDKFLNMLTSNALSNELFDNLSLLLYVFLWHLPKDMTPENVEVVISQLESEFQDLLGTPSKFVHDVAVLCFLDRRFSGEVIRRCLCFSRPLKFSVDDQLYLLKHLYDVDIDVAFEVSLQLLLIHQSESVGKPVWAKGGVCNDLFKLIVDIFVRKHYFDAPLHLCLAMSSEAARTTALHHFFKRACFAAEPHYSSFMRLICSSSARSEVDLLAECIRFMCTSKEQLLLERACAFYAERGSRHLPEALAIAARIGDCRFLPPSKTSTPLERAEVELLVSHRRLIIEEGLAKLPDFVRQRIVEKSRSEESSWMFVACSSLPTLDGSMSSQLLPVTENADDDSTLSLYHFDWSDVENLLRLPPNNPFLAASQSLPVMKHCNSSSFSGRRSTVMNFGSQLPQPRLSTAKKCRFVDSPVPLSDEDQMVAAAKKPSFFIGDTKRNHERDMGTTSFEQQQTKIVAEVIKPDTSLLSSSEMSTPVLPYKVEIRKQGTPSDVVRSTVTTSNADSGTGCILIDSDEEEEELGKAGTSAVRTPAVATPLQKSAVKSLAASSVKELSPAQKAAKRIIKRSVRFSSSPRSPIDVPSLARPAVVVNVTPAAPARKIPDSTSSDDDVGDIVEISSDDGNDDNAGNEPEREDNLSFEENDELYMEEGEDEEEEEEEYQEDAEVEEEERSLVEEECEDASMSSSGESPTEVYLSPIAEIQLVEQHHHVSTAYALRYTEEKKLVQIDDKSESQLLVEMTEVENVTAAVEPLVEMHPPDASLTFERANLVDENVAAAAAAADTSSRRGFAATNSTKLTMKSVSNISPNRLAAQIALRRSMRIVTTKKKQELQDAKKPVSSSLEENAEPPSSSVSPHAILANDTTAGEQTDSGDVFKSSNNNVSRLNLPPAVEPAVHQLKQADFLPQAVLPAEQSLPVIVVQSSATADNNNDDLPQPLPPRMTRSRSTAASSTTSSVTTNDKTAEDASSTIANDKQLHRANNLDVSLPIVATVDADKAKRRRKTDLEKLSPQSTVSESTIEGVSTRRRATRLRHTSGSSEAAVSEVAAASSDLSNQPAKRQRTQSASEAMQTFDVTLLPPLSPRRHMRAVLTPTIAEAPKAAAEESSSSSSSMSRAQSLPPNTRKRSQAQVAMSAEDEAAAGLITPSSSPKRRARGDLSAVVSASAEKMVPASEDEDARRHRSAPTSPSRRTRRSSAMEQAAQIATALSSITDSPAFHTRRHGVASSVASSVYGGDDAVTVASAEDSPASSIVSAASSSRRSTRGASKRAAVNR